MEEQALNRLASALNQDLLQARYELIMALLKNEELELKIKELQEDKDNGLEDSEQVV